jgi:hypothetical protein
MSSRSTDRRRSPEDVRGADVGEARELLLDMLSDVCTNVHVHDYGALPGGIDLGKHADRILAALRSPEPAAEPVAWGVWENSHFQFADHNEVAARAMAEDIRGFPDCRGEVEVRALYAHPPSAEPATGRDQKMGAPEREVPSAGGEPRYTLDEDRE